MASVKKFTNSAVYNQIRHNDRTLPNSSNTDINPEKYKNDYSLHPNRNMSDYDYYQSRKKELYCYGRKDVKTLAGWIVTAPIDIPKEEYESFFQSSYNFLSNRYGENNCVQAVIHDEEGGQPHLHFLFIPVVNDKKHGGEKICANDILNRKELRSFHPELQKYLNSDGLHANIMSGITKEQGGNKTVREMKKEKKRKYEHERNIERRW